MRPRAPARRRPARPGGVGANVGAALLLGHAHPAGAPSLSPTGAAPARTRGRRAAEPSGAASVRVVAQGRRRRIRHRHGTAVAGLDLAPDDEPDRAAQRAPRPGRARPRLRGQAVRDGGAQQGVVCGVVVDLVGPLPGRPVGAQPRRVAVGVLGPALRGGRSGGPAQCGAPGRRRLGTGRPSTSRPTGRDDVSDGVRCPGTSIPCLRGGGTWCGRIRMRRATRRW